MRTLILLPGLLLGHAGFSQATGFQLGGDLYHPVIKSEGAFDPGATIYLGIHKDFNLRIGAEVDVKVLFSEQSMGTEFIYKAKYFCSANDATAFYVGSFLGVQRLKGEYTERIGTSSYGYGIYEDFSYSKTLIPIGVHLGVRGGLDGYFAELNLMLGYSIGGGSAVGSGINAPEINAMYAAVGFSWLGFGWDK